MSSKAEKSYVQSSFLSIPPLRADGRGLHDYRAISLETGVAPLANGSARVHIGRGTEILAAVKLDVETIQNGDDGVDGGRIVCSVSWFASISPFITI
jgi:exosome complex component RRP42